jgi:RNA 3'-terminal phosphate cyclase (ATP)
MIEIDGSAGEGGGQIVRTALTLAMSTASPIRIRGIRARRSNPGLRAQHLAAVHAAAAICGARIEGAAIASPMLTFIPGALRPGHYEIDVGTAGSTMLVLQTVLPALSLCNAPSQILLRGGTHNPRAPTFEFIQHAYLPLLARLGYQTGVSLERYGFYPRGGGLVRASIEPLRRADCLELLERGPVRSRTARVLISRLPSHIAQREIDVLRDRLGLHLDACGIDTVTAPSAGNTLHVRLESLNVDTVFCGFGIRGVAAETVAGHVADEVERYLSAEVALDRHLADQLLVPLALSAGGRFSSLTPSGHTETNAEVMKRFLPVDYEALELGARRWYITLRPRNPHPQRRTNGSLIIPGPI